MSCDPKTPLPLSPSLFPKLIHNELGSEAAWSVAGNHKWYGEAAALYGKN